MRGKKKAVPQVSNPASSDSLRDKNPSSLDFALKFAGSLRPNIGKVYTCSRPKSKLTFVGPCIHEATLLVYGIYRHEVSGINWVLSCPTGDTLPPTRHLRDWAAVKRWTTCLSEFDLVMGGTYRHYKGGLYTLVNRALWSNSVTGQISFVVAYTNAKTAFGTVWMRTFEDFNETINVPRFSLVKVDVSAGPAS